MNSRSRMTMAPLILTMPGRSTSGCHRSGTHRVHLARGFGGRWWVEVEVEGSEGGGVGDKSGGR